MRHASQCKIDHCFFFLMLEMLNVLVVVVVVVAVDYNDSRKNNKTAWAKEANVRARAHKYIRDRGKLHNLKQ